MPEPTARQGHIDVALTNVAIAYGNAAYIGTTIFPRLTVAKQTNKYFTFGKNAWYRDETAIRAPGTRANRAEYTLSTDSYLCVEKAVSKQVPDEEVENSDDPLRPLVRATEYVTDQVLKAQEISILSDVFGTGWASSATPSPTWDDDTSDPLKDIATGFDTIAKAIGRPPNIGVIGGGLWRYLKNHPDIVDRVKGGATGGNPARVTLDAIAALIEIPRLLVSYAVRDTADEGAAASVGYIAGNHMFLGYVDPSPSLTTPSAGYLFEWKTRTVNRYREDQEHAWVVESLANWDVKLTATDAGYLVKSAA